MPRGTSAGRSTKGRERDEAIREAGLGKEAAPSATESAAEGLWKVGRRIGRATNFEDRTKDDLLDSAREIGIEGRSRMSRQQLIDALRDR